MGLGPINGDQNWRWISTPADSKGEFLLGGETDIGISRGEESLSHDMGIGLSLCSIIQKLWGNEGFRVYDKPRTLTWMETYPVIGQFEPIRLDHEHFPDVSEPHVGPAFLLSYCLVEFFQRRKPIRVGYQTEFVWAMAQDVVEKLGELFGLTSCHFQCSCRWSVVSRQLSWRIQILRFLCRYTECSPSIFSNF